MSQHCLARGCDDDRLEGTWFCMMHQPLANVYRNAPPAVTRQEASAPAQGLHHAPPARRRQLCLGRGCDDERLEGTWFCRAHQPLANVYCIARPPPPSAPPVPHEDSKPVERAVEWMTVALFLWVIGFTLFLIGQAMQVW